MLFWTSLLTLGACTALAAAAILCFFNFVGLRAPSAANASQPRPVSLESEIGPRAVTQRTVDREPSGVIVLEGRNISYGVG